MAISQNFPNTRPSLNLNFARSKTLDPRITFIRTQTGSEASYVDESGIIRYASADEPRFDHDPETGRCLGLMIEEQRTNVLTYSDYSQGGSSANTSVTPNDTVSPDGTTNASSVDGANSNSNLKYLYKEYGTTTQGTYTFSVFAKYKSEQYIVIRINDNGGANDAQQRYDILNGTKSGSLGQGGTATNGSSTITPYPNGWYRLTVTCTFNSALTQIQSAIWLTGYQNTTTTNGVYLWGAQLEAGQFPTSYIPTTSSQATRSKDSVSMTGTNFSDWYNPSESTFLVSFRQIYDASSTVPSSTTHVIQAGNDTTVNDNYTIRSGQSQTNWSSLVRSASPSSLQFPGIVGFGYLNSSTLYKVALSVNSSLISVSLNGLLNADITNTTTVNHSTPFNKLFIGSGTGGLPPYELSGHISQLTYYPTRLSNTVLQSLTK